MFDRSPLLADFAASDSVYRKFEFEIHGKTRNQAYLLADGIYNDLSFIVQAIPEPHTAKRQHFAAMQESLRRAKYLPWK